MLPPLSVSAFFTAVRASLERVAKGFSYIPNRIRIMPRTRYEHKHRTIDLRGFPVGISGLKTIVKQVLIFCKHAWPPGHYFFMGLNSFKKLFSYKLESVPLTVLRSRPLDILTSTGLAAIVSLCFPIYRFAVWLFSDGSYFA